MKSKMHTIGNSGTNHINFSLKPRGLNELSFSLRLTCMIVVGRDLPSRESPSKYISLLVEKDAIPYLTAENRPLFHNPSGSYSRLCPLSLRSSTECNSTVDLEHPLKEMNITVSA